MPSLALTGAIIFTGDAFIEGHTLLVKDNKVLDLVQNDQIPDDFTPTSCANHILAPGFIDCQVNGGDNILFNGTPTVEAILGIAAAHRRFGTTRLLPTCLTDKNEVMEQAILAMRQARQQDTSILGIHTEGPHINEKMAGMHSAQDIRSIKPEDMALYKREGDECFLITVAPETVSPEEITALKDNGLIISLGHSMANAELTHEALNAGASCFTHIYNRMPALTGRDGGIASVALTDPKSYCSIILDGRHISKEMAQMACAAQPEDKLFMVSDAMPPSATETPKQFSYKEKTFTPDDGVCKGDMEMLAGAQKTLGECVPVAIKQLCLDPARVLKMASTIPAAMLGLDDHLGKLLPGYTADIVALDHSFKTTTVWKDGKAV